VTSVEPSRLALVHLVPVAGARDPRRLDALLAAGVTALWLRDPEATGRALFDAALVLREATRRAGALLLVGDRVDVALAVGADGVQLGRRAIPAARAREIFPGRLGVSCHDAEELAAAAQARADHAILSPVHDVPGKGPPLGLDGLVRLLRGTRLPVVALGGIDTTTAAAVRATGVAGIAVARALADAPDPTRTARELLRRGG
jgi:thiamine-phosphate diphosphorylase